MKFGIIGFGNLGRALASGLISSGCARAGSIYVCDKLPEARALAESEPYFARADDDVNAIIANSDVIFLTIKSYVFEELSSIIDKSGLTGKTVVSFMAGVPFGKIYSLIGEVRLVRENCCQLYGRRAVRENLFPYRRSSACARDAVAGYRFLRRRHRLHGGASGDSGGIS